MTDVLDQLAFMQHGVAVAAIVALLGGALSIIVVLKRLAFVGQGVSHAAFGGVGLAAILGFNATTTTDSVARTIIVAAFSIGAGLLIARLSVKTQKRTDTAIGIVMTASMALGFVLSRVAAVRAVENNTPRPQPIEGVLFGELISLGAPALLTTAVASVCVLGALFWFRRPILLWAFDEEACAPAGISPNSMRSLSLVLLAGTVVLAVQVAGVVLATAMIVLPGATALRLTRRLVPAFILSVAIALVSVAVGVLSSIALDWPPGSTIALAQCAVWVVAAFRPNA